MAKVYIVPDVVLHARNLSAGEQQAAAQSKHTIQTSTAACSDPEGGLGDHVNFRMLPERGRGGGGTEPNISHVGTACIRDLAGLAGVICTYACAPPAATLHNYRTCSHGTHGTATRRCSITQKHHDQCTAACKGHSIIRLRGFSYTHSFESWPCWLPAQEQAR